MPEGYSGRSLADIDAEIAQEQRLRDEAYRAGHDVEREDHIRKLGLLSRERAKHPDAVPVIRGHHDNDPTVKFHAFAVFQRAERIMKHRVHAASTVVGAKDTGLLDRAAEALHGLHRRMKVHPDVPADFRISSHASAAIRHRDESVMVGGPAHTDAAKDSDDGRGRYLHLSDT